MVNGLWDADPFLQPVTREPLSAPQLAKIKATMYCRSSHDSLFGLISGMAVMALSLLLMKK